MAGRTREEWLGLFQAQLDSGLTATEFCRHQGIDPNYFSRRKGQFGRDRELAGKSVGFVQLKPPAPVVGGFEVRVGEVRLSLPPGASPSWVAALIRELGNATV